MAKATTQASPLGSNGTDKGQRHRSPNYPALNLSEAVDKLTGLFDAMKRHPVGVEVAVRAMGYSYSSSTGKLALAAFRAFGLLENVHVGANATVKLSMAALDIAADYPRESVQWWAAVKKAALAPNVHSLLWEKYGANMPADDEVRRFLVRELKFSDKAVDAFIDEYKATIAFAKLSEADIIGGEGGGDDRGEDDEGGGDDGRRQGDHKRGRLKRSRSMSTGLKEDVCSLDEGEAVFQWPENLSAVSAQDLDDWLKLIGKKIKRAAGKTSGNGPADDPDEDDGNPGE